jgi:hypothetical protein
MDVRGFVTIKAVEEQAIGTWNIGNCGHAPALCSCKKMCDVSHSISDLFSETTPEFSNAFFGCFSSDLAPNAIWFTGEEPHAVAGRHSESTSGSSSLATDS